MDARGYHLVNLIFHCLVCLIYTSLVKRWTFRESNEHFTDSFSSETFKSSKIYVNDSTRSIKLNLIEQLLRIKQLNPLYLIKQLSNLNLPPIYLISSLLFALHPIHVEAVAGLVGRADIGCGFFFLLSLYFYNNYLEHLYRESSHCSSVCLSNCTSFKAAKPTNDSNSQLNERGGKELKEKRLMKSTYLETTNDPIVESVHLTNENWSFSFFHLYFAIFCGLISFLFKEYGLMVFIVCAFYHLITHCNYLEQINNQSKRLVNLNPYYFDYSTKRRWSTYNQLTNTTKQDKFYSSLRFTRSIESTEDIQTKLFAFSRSLHAILTNVS